LCDPWQTYLVALAQIGEYQLIATLGRGGMADVYLATRRGPAGFAKLVVIKRLRADLALAPDASRYRALLLDEAKLAARMYHPNIVQTFEVDDDGGEPFIAMEYLDGQPIDRVIRAAKSTGGIPHRFSLRVASELLSGLSYVHALTDFDGKPLRIVHRDVNPQNIFWTYNGEIKLVDFGVAKFARGADQTESGIVKGKVAYLAPEQARGAAIDARTDVFAAGITLWEMLAGRRLFRAANQAAALHKLLYEPVPRLADVVPNIDPQIAAICERALERDPARRYADAVAMRAEIDAIVGTPPLREELAAFVEPLFDAQRAAMSNQIRAALHGESSVELPLASPDPTEELEVASDTIETVHARRSSARPARSSPTQPTIVQPKSRRRLIVGLLAAILVTSSAAIAVAWTRLGSASRDGDNAGDPGAVAVAALERASRSRATVAPTPALRLCGSNTVGAELAPALVEAFLKHKGATEISRRVGDADQLEIDARLGGALIAVDLRARGTATAFDGLAANACDIGMASRAITDAEVKKLAAVGILDPRSPASEHVIALDGIAVIVHPNNPLRELDRTALHDLFTGKISNWSQLGGAPGPVSVYARDAKSGTYDTFKHLVIADGDLPPSAKRFERSDVLADGVASDPSAIGFIGLAYVRSAKSLALHEPGLTAMLPTSFTVTTEDYMLSRRLYFYTPPRPRTQLATELVSFTLSPEGQTVVRDAGFVDLDLTLHDATSCDARCPPRYAELTRGAKRVSLDFRFRSGSDEIDSRAMRDLDRLVQLLRAQPVAKLELFGFSDVVGATAANVRLSRSRAQTIAHELSSRGISADVVEGFGAAMPIASANDIERNRRVEVWLRPSS
jgi:phosphate transport system substrate-binding protein